MDNFKVPAPLLLELIVTAKRGVSLDEKQAGKGKADDPRNRLLSRLNLFHLLAGVK